MRRRLLAPIIALTLVLGVGCSVEEPELKSGPPVTTGDLPAITTTTVAGATLPPSTVEVAPTSCNTTVSPALQEKTRVATAKASLAEIAVYVADGATIPCTTLANPDTDYQHPQVFFVLQQLGDWVEVLLPSRPNASSGWVKAADVDIAELDYRIEVSLSGHNVKLKKGNEVLVDTPAGVGTDDTPTPPGVYYLVGLLKPTNDGYGPYAYALSGHSEKLETFAGGDGRLGLHGTDDPSSIGRDVSHGCIRIPNDVITEMAEDIGLPLGVPVIVTA